MIHKKTSALLVALALLLIGYSIAAAKNLQDQVQQQFQDTQPLQTELGIGKPGSGSFAGNVSPVVDDQVGTQNFAKNRAGQKNLNNEIMAGSMEETLGPAWLVGWIVQDIGALSLITVTLLGSFWLVQKRRRV